MQNIARLWLASLLLVVSGCAHYRYYVVEPDRFAQPVPANAVSTVDYDPLEYRFSERDHRLVVGIRNPTDGMIRFLANRSYVVDPEGQSRSLQVGNASIAPRSFISLFLPPEIPVAYPSPAFGMGMGFGYGYGYGYGLGYPYGGYPWRYGHGYDPFYYQRFGLYAPFDYEPSFRVQKVPVWKWKTGTVALRLFYQREKGGVFDHQFVFDRQKVDRR